MINHVTVIIQIKRRTTAMVVYGVVVALMLAFGMIAFAQDDSECLDISDAPPDHPVGAGAAQHHVRAG
jgi:hypothetical protein